MFLLATIDWHALFKPQVGLFEIFLRGSVVYIEADGRLSVLKRKAEAGNAKEKDIRP